MQLSSQTVLHAPPLHRVEAGGLVHLIDPQGPNWLSTDARGAAILGAFDGLRPLGEVVADYAREQALDWVEAWQ